jgi:tetratricopeptide (TPR) repeat protein
LPEARAILEKLVEKNDKNNLALAALGDVNLAEGKTQVAEDLFNRSLSIDPKNSAVRLALADLYIKQNRLDEAQGIIESLISKDPANSTLRFYLGEFLLARGSAEKATEQYRELLKSDPKRHEARDRLYDLLVLKKENEKAKELTAELIKLEPASPGSSYFQGRDLELEGKLPEALTLYLKAIEGLPGFAPLFRHTGIIEFALGKTQEGVEHLNQAVSINGNDVGARVALARHYFLSRDFAQAKEQTTQVLKNFPRQIGANIIRADIALIEGDLKLAEAVYKALAETLPNNPVGYFKLAALEETKKNVPAAIGFYKKGLSYDVDVLMPAQRVAQLLVFSEGIEKSVPQIVALRDASKNNKAEYNVILGASLVSFARGNPELGKQAREFLTVAINEKPDLLPAYFSMAQLDAAEGKLKDSEQSYKKILEKQPNHVPSRMLLAMSNELRGDTDGAISEYQKIMDVSPNFAAAANNLAWLIASTGKGGSLDKALDLALKAKEKLPQVAAVADTLGYIYLKRDTPKAALAVLEEAVELERKNAPPGPDGVKLINPEILFHLATAQNALDMKAEAKKTAQEALKLSGEKAPYYAELKKIAE